MKDNILEELAKNNHLSKDPLFAQKLAACLHTFYIEDEGNIEKNIMKIIGKSELDHSLTLMPKQLDFLKAIEKDGDFVVSAPTSFGKTFLMLEFIKRNENKFKKIIYIVHTKSLKDELYDKISRYLSDFYNIIDDFEQIIFLDRFICILISDGQNIYESCINIDLLIVDEAYNLSKIHSNERYFCIINTYRKLLESSNKNILIGPYIKSIDGLGASSYKLLKTDYSPVVSHIFEGEDLIDLSPDLLFIEKIINQESTIAYFNSKFKIYSFMNDIVNSKLPDIYTDAFIEMMEDNFPSFWLLPKVMKKGISIYHSSFPKYINKYNMSKFNSCKFSGLITTSAILEGVNTSSKNLVIFESKIGSDTPLTPFQFFNLCGRVGRLGKEVIGDVYNFGDLYKDKYSMRSLPLYIGNENAITVEEKIDEELLDDQTSDFLNTITDMLSSININFSEWYVKNKYYCSGISNLRKMLEIYFEYRVSLTNDILSGELITDEETINKNKIIRHIYEGFVGPAGFRYHSSSQFYAPIAIQVLLMNRYGGINFNVKMVCNDYRIKNQLSTLDISEKNSFIVELMNVGYNYIPHTFYNIVYIFNEFLMSDDFFDVSLKNKIFTALFNRLQLYVSKGEDNESKLIVILNEIGLIPSLIDKIKKYLFENDVDISNLNRYKLSKILRNDIIPNLEIEECEFINLQIVNLI